MFALFLLLSGFGCHYLHLHKGECQTDQYLEGCRVYKSFKNGVNIISSHVIILKIIFTKQYPSDYRIKEIVFVHFSQFSNSLKQDDWVISILCAFNYNLWHFIAILSHIFTLLPPLVLQSECWIKENPRQSAEEIFGFDSRCFFSSLTRQVCVSMYANACHQLSPLFNINFFFLHLSLFKNQSQFLLFSSSVEGRCYRHRCTGPNRYRIQVSGSEWVDCPAGDTIQVT